MARENAGMKGAGRPPATPPGSTLAPGQPLDPATGPGKPLARPVSPGGDRTGHRSDLVNGHSILGVQVTHAADRLSRCVIIAGCGYRARSADLGGRWLNPPRGADCPDLSLLVY